MTTIDYRIGVIDVLKSGIFTPVLRGREVRLKGKMKPQMREMSRLFLKFLNLHSKSDVKHGTKSEILYNLFLIYEITTVRAIDILSSSESFSRLSTICQI